MKLLFITRKVDETDERAGFVIDWILELAKNLEKLVVICQEKGEATGLPENVEIHSLGKEKGHGKFKQFILFHCFIVSLLKKVGGVFSHMIPHYAVAVGPWCKIFHKKLVQWYTHKSVNIWLKLANIFVDEFVTASRESFRMKTKRPVHVWGHGININKFQISNFKFQNNFKIQKSKVKILTVGRISPVKNLDILIKALEQIQLNEPELRDKILLQIIGGPGLITQATYMKELEEEVHQKNLDKVVDFLGPLPHNELINYYQNCDLFINLSDTGSIDKVVLEAMACQKLVLTSNEAFKNILPPELFLREKNPTALAKKIKEIYNLPIETKEELRKKLRQIVTENHNLEILTKRIVELFKPVFVGSKLLLGAIM